MAMIPHHHHHHPVIMVVLSVRKLILETTTGQMLPLLDVMAGPLQLLGRFQARVLGKMGSMFLEVLIHV
jgi:hypothetical protein